MTQLRYVLLAMFHSPQMILLVPATSGAAIEGTISRLLRKSPQYLLKVTGDPHTSDEPSIMMKSFTQLVPVRPFAMAAIIATMVIGDREKAPA